MCITITINNANDKIESLIKEKFNEEQINFFKLWENSDDNESFTAYQENILPIINSFEINLSNDNFKSIFEILGYTVNILGANYLSNFLVGEEEEVGEGGEEGEVEEIAGAIECTGYFDGGKLEIFKNRIKNILKVIRNSPNQFECSTIENNFNGLHIIEVGKDSSYYEDRLNKILILCEKTDKIVWY